MTLIVYRKLFCGGCTSQYPPPRAERFVGTSRELREAAQAVGWATGPDDSCPSCRIRQIQAVMVEPQAAR